MFKNTITLPFSLKLHFDTLEDETRYLLVIRSVIDGFIHAVT